LPNPATGINLAPFRGMGSCSYCDTLYLFSSKSDDYGQYCSARCQLATNLLVRSRGIEPAEIERLVQETYHSNCPRCGGPGPIDVHKAHQVWSVVFLTSWSSKPQLSCKGCGTKRQISAMITSFLFGWWGFPWGLGMTPVQIVRNVIEMAGRSKSNTPTRLLEKYVRLNAAARLMQSSEQATPATPPIINTPPGRPEPQGDERYMPKTVAK
jgi:hypothetical protein